MKIIRKPIVLVRHVGNLIEYYLQEGNKKINFFLTPQFHADLKDAQAQADAVPQRRAGEKRVAIELKEVVLDQKSSAAGL